MFCFITPPTHDYNHPFPRLPLIILLSKSHLPLPCLELFFFAHYLLHFFYYFNKYYLK